MAVTRCCLQRALTSISTNIINKNGYLTPDYVTSSRLQCLSKPSNRSYAAYYRTLYVEDLKGLPDFEVLKSPPQWKYVERLLPVKTVPKPIPKDEYPSGWIPQNQESANLPYFVSRTKNHMVPVHLKLTFRGARKVTRVSGIQGDIWLLADELKKYLDDETNNFIIPFSVHELIGRIDMKGDVVSLVKQFLLKKGF